jgi:type IV pilus assembly protein PilC
MHVYKYRAVDKVGQPARGRLDASNEADLELRLKRMGLDLITYREVGTSFLPTIAGRIKRQDLITFCFHMEQISRSGIPMLEGMRDLTNSVDNTAFREIISSVQEEMEGGAVLSQALASHPEVFDHVFSSLVRAGEQTGSLAEVFQHLADTLKWQDELISHTRRLLIYPAIVLAVVGAVVFFLLIFLVPQITGLLKNMGVELPLQTRILVYLSAFVSKYWLPIIGIPSAMAIVVALAVRKNARARYLLDYIALRLPITGPILSKIILARFANFFALMYRSGISILDALRICESIVSNRVIADGLQRAGQRISAGDGLTESFRNIGLFPPLVLRMLAIGETTGALDTSLLNVAYFYNRDIRDSIEKALKLLEPALTVFLGLIMVAIMFSVLMPVYDVLGKMKF